ncbi:MAG TPA: outer membrane beta-barrel protein [Mucilaginibacter sp.]
MIKTRYLLVLCFTFCSKILFAQYVPAWGGGADQQDLSFGFSFSYVSSDYKITKKPDWRKPFFDTGSNKYITDSLTGIGSKNVPGFAIGFLTRYTLTEHFEVRATPSLVFCDRSLSYTYANPEQNQVKQVQTTSVEVPLSIKIKSDRLGDFRAYMLGGVKYTKAIGSKKNEANTDPLDKLVLNAGGFSSWEAGLGCDIYFEYFKLSPQIKVSNSFGNILVPENHPFSSPISKLSLHTVMFSLFFE